MWLQENTCTALTAQKMKFSIKDFFSKCDQFPSFLRNFLFSKFIRRQYSVLSSFILVFIYFMGFFGWFTYLIFLVPSVPVPNITLTDMVSTEWFSVRWGKIPDDYVNGILRGYRLTYYLSYRASLPIGGELVKMQQDFSIFTFYYKVTGLVNYAVYNVSIAGFTNAGDGVSEEFYASKYL